MNHNRGTEAYKYCNHHHVLDEDQEIVDFGIGEFVADKVMIPLLKALNDAGLKTRTHCGGHGEAHCFVGIILDDADVSLDIRKVIEMHSTRNFENKHEVIISWNPLAKDKEE